MSINFEALLNPSAEFSPFPFWFLNGNLDEGEIDRQLHDFSEKGINGIVRHECDLHIAGAPYIMFTNPPE